MGGGKQPPNPPPAPVARSSPPPPPPGSGMARDCLMPPLDADSPEGVQYTRFRDFLRILNDCPRDGQGRYVVPASAVRYANGEDVSPLSCTGLTARWCPVHGTCTCPEGSFDGNSQYLLAEVEADEACPLHDLASSHPEPGGE